MQLMLTFVSGFGLGGVAVTLVWMRVIVRGVELRAGMRKEAKFQDLRIAELESELRIERNK